MRLKNKVALITGGSTGIGKAITEIFVKEGAKVTIADINKVQGRKTARENKCLFVFCDISNENHVEIALNSTISSYGKIDILVNCAANLGGPNNVVNITTKEWRDVLSVSLDGVFYCSKHIMPELIKAGSGSIINISSVEGMLGAFGHSAYVTAKSGLFGLTKSMAIDFGKFNIRVNSISPGIIDSERPDIKKLKKNKNIMKFWCDMTVLDRLGKPIEIANTALFLATDESSYITGQNIAVDGGWTIGHLPINLDET
jgi:meso-butanediol dehydrogenase / (S,S)-butanediol dehydrogenase / diacetyl reductase